MKTKSRHSDLTDWLPLLGCLLIAFSPLLTKYCLPEKDAYRHLKEWMSANAWYVSICGVGTILAVAFWHSFEKFEEAQNELVVTKNEKADLVTDLKTSQDRVARLSDSRVMGQANLEDELLVSISVTVDLLTKPRPGISAARTIAPPPASMGTLLLISGNLTLVTVKIGASDIQKTDGNLRFQITSHALLDQTWIGKPFSILYEADAIRIECSPYLLSTGDSVVGGVITWLVNNHCLHAVNVPEQGIAGKPALILIGGVKDGFKRLS